MPAGEWPHIFSAIQRVGVGVLAEREQLALACRAVAAGDRERHDDAVADLEVRDARPTSTTSPMNSWPRMSPVFMVGT